MGTPIEGAEAGTKRPVHLRAEPMPTRTQEMMAFDPSSIAAGDAHRPADAPADAVETRCGQWVEAAEVCETAQQARRRARDDGRAICQPCLTFASG